MLPSKREKISQNTSFKRLVADAMMTCIKNELDRLTLPIDTATPVNYAEVKLLTWLREKMRTGSILNHQTGGLIANEIHVGGIIAMFDDTENDDVESSDDLQGALIIDWDASKQTIVEKIMNNGYLYGLSGVENADFAKDINGNPLP